MAAAAWIEARTDRAQRGRLLARLGEGATDDEALTEVLSLDTQAIDAALRRAIRDEFPNSDHGIASGAVRPPASAREP
jgi:hypothetical protein